MGTQEDFALYVAVDTGATNTRVAIGTKTEFVLVAHFKCSCTKHLVASLNEIALELATLVDPASCVRAGCLDAAGRVSEFGKLVDITNYTGERFLALSDLPPALFPPGRSRILNDLESACYGISGLNASGRLDQYFTVLFGKESENDSLPFENHLVCAIGTGMGVGLMMALNGSNDFVVLPLEAGHIQFNPCSMSDPRREEENQMIQFIGGQLYNDKCSLEYEDLSSGRGLLKLYEWAASCIHKECNKSLSAVEISELAIKGECEAASKALFYHYLYLARGSANLAVGLQAKGIFWAGGNQVSNHNFVAQHSDKLREEFLSHTKVDWIKDCPIYTQINRININLEGAFHVSRV